MDSQAYLAGKLHIEELRRAKISDVTERHEIERQLREILLVYADLVNVREVIASMYDGDDGAGGLASSDEIRSLALQIPQRRRLAMERHANGAKWAEYYADMLWLPWIPSIYHLGKLYAHKKWQWFSPDSARQSLQSLLVSTGKIVPIS